MRKIFVLAMAAVRNEKNLPKGIIAAVFALLCVQFVSCKPEPIEISNSASASASVSVSVTIGADTASYTVTAKDVVGSSSSIKTVKAELKSGKVLATASYSNSAFTVKLPVPEQKDLEELGNGVYYCQPGFYAYNSSDEQTGEFVYADMGNRIFGNYVYVDKNAAFNGKILNCDADLSLKKGWNIWYLVNGLLTTEKQSGELQWYYVPNSTKSVNGEVQE